MEGFCKSAICQPKGVRVTKIVLSQTPEIGWDRMGLEGKREDGMGRERGEDKYGKEWDGMRHDGTRNKERGRGKDEEGTKYDGMGWEWRGGREGRERDGMRRLI